MEYDKIYIQNKREELYGRYIKLNDIEPILKSFNRNNQLKTIGYSVLNRPIYSYQIGCGKHRILLWSQMHGNESTTTKALLDFIAFLNSETTQSNHLLNQFTFNCIPMLNPDGAHVYTRENANKVDLNRDFKGYTQPESKLLRSVFDEFKPHYCYNLHDQRTIFGIRETKKPATVSFLAPSYNENRDYNAVRTQACAVINAMNAVLQSFIPGQIGRFDDSYNDNCAGDCFQSLGVPTILFEAGHFPNDYQRETTRKFIFIALISSFEFISENDIVDNVINKYLNIPQNKVLFYDFVYKNVKINYDNEKKIINFAAQYKEELINSKIIFSPYIVQVGDIESFLGHYEHDGRGLQYQDENGFTPRLNSKADFVLGNKIKVINGFVLIE